MIPVKRWWPVAARLHRNGQSPAEIAKLLKVRRYGVVLALKAMGLR
jgi:hypothetical protein